MPSHWHSLLADLPPSALPEQRPVASEEILAGPDGAAVAGWTSLILHLSAGVEGHRTLQVTLDATETPISAGDTSFHCDPVAGGTDRVRYRYESIGGRYEPDGSFRGTRWLATYEAAADEDPPPVAGKPSQPDPSQVTRLDALVQEMIRRAGNARAVGPPPRQRGEVIR